MLTCMELAGVASDYIDGMLPFGEKLSVGIHLAMCGHCRSFIGNLRASIKVMEAHSSVTPDEEFLRRIDEEVEQALRTREPGN